MMKEVDDALVGCDLLLLMVDAAQKFGDRRRVRARPGEAH